MKIVNFSLSEEQIEFVGRAAKSCDMSKSGYIRQAVLTAASVQLGEDAPEAPAAAADAITEAATAQGMTRQQFVRYATLVTAGVDPATAKERATRPRKARTPRAAE